MNTRQIERFVKTYFYFSKTERKGIIQLLVLLTLVLLAIPAYKLIFPPQPFVVNIEDLPVDETKFSTHSSTPEEKNFHNFNPNTASDDELKSLGFSDKNISTIRKYLSKGGSFKSADDLKKMYGLKPELVQQLLPFVSINNQKIPNQKLFSDSAKSKQKTVQKVVEINTADSVELVKLYRIGPALASRIIEQRAKLGGFLNLNQLTEIYGFEEDILYDLEGKIKVDASLAKRINLNTVSIEELKTHPYFKYKLSNAIINYRTQHGNFKTLEDLKQIKIVNDSILKLILVYGFVE